MSTIASIASASVYASSTTELLAGTDTSSTSILDEMSQVVEQTSSDSTANDPSDIVDLSEQAKTLLDQAKANKLATEKIDAFLQNGSKPDGANTNSTSSGPQQQAGAADSSASGPQSFQTFTLTQSLYKSITYDGYTFTLDTDAGTQWYGIELSGNGIQATDKHFGPSDQFAGASGVTPGVEISNGIPNSNNEAFDAITVTRNAATASSASISSSSGASASASAINAQSSSITFLVNYKTGQISIEQSAASVSSGSILSTRA
jgi:hypothetical protein